MESSDLDLILMEFKNRMKIFHDSEDEDLKRILFSSIDAIYRMTGSNNLEKHSIKELVFERSRYAYNDSLEFFESNFQAQIIGVSLEVATTDDNEIQT